ncbi:FAD-dependent oxidoreductase [Paramixta manurensis]|uniref:FAD-dependent oxidoreductase n=1 Tax=Paramixta manurensis TaxID=2740817 RepID=A0A6M8UU46_9GAMM|nr:FAD-dependent oxidoreductase [Erwiniaceae bacterium PD-1]
MSRIYEVIIIGAGPSGLAVAHALNEAGIKDVLLLERENQAGGVPRHCRHPTFGLQTFHRPMSGHVWAEKLVKRVAYPVRTNTTVTALKPGGVIEITSDNGMETLQARKVVLATGVRETPRHARLVSGVRPQGVLTAGALQQFVYLRGLRPGEQPVIVGTELVSFSALWTLRNAGIRPVAMVDDNPRPTAWRPSLWFAKLLRVPVYLGHHLSAIQGGERVQGIEITNQAGEVKTLRCDSVIFTGKFTGEYTLIRKSHLASDSSTGRPLFDQHGCCSDPHYFAVGNMTHPADMGDQCYQEGRRVGRYIADVLHETQEAGSLIPVQHDDIFRISAPSVIRRAGALDDVTFNLRVEHPGNGYIVVRNGDKVLYRRRHHCMPERRILLKHVDLTEVMTPGALRISFEG